MTTNEKTIEAIKEIAKNDRLMGYWALALINGVNLPELARLAKRLGLSWTGAYAN